MKTKFYPKRSYSFAAGRAAKLLLLLVLVVSLQKVAIAQNFHLVKDMNTRTDGDPNNQYSSFNSYLGLNSTAFAVTNGVSYFAAKDNYHGVGLWRSDGTTAGTYQVKDSINPFEIVAANGKVFFKGPGNPGLWVSDGTEAGTVPVLTAVPSPLGGFFPANLTAFNSTLYFTVTAHAKDDQLWKTDGTAGGTVLVKDFYDPGIVHSLSNLVNFVVVNNKLYFCAENQNTNYPFLSTLWVSNGSTAGTHIISDTLYNPAHIVAHSNNIQDPLVYFSATNAQGGNRTLYLTNGDSGVVNHVSGFNAYLSLISQKQQGLLNRNGVLYFVGNTTSPDKDQSLYKFNGNSPGSSVQPVKVFTSPGPNGRYAAVSDLIEVNGSLFFVLYDPSLEKVQLWKTDGTNLGSVLVKEISPGVNSLIDLGGVLYFGASNDTSGYELWKSDGTANGTAMVKDINPGKVNSYFYGQTIVNGKLLFNARDSAHGSELWISDGTAAGTNLLKDINSIATSSSDPFGLTAVNGRLVFSAFDYGNGSTSRIYVSDGTASGTEGVSDTIFTLLAHERSAMLNNELYFMGNGSYNYMTLVKTNGTKNGTIPVKTFPAIGFPLVKSTNSLVYVYLYNIAEKRYELWRSDGTSANTYLIKSDFNGNISSDRTFCAVSDKLFFNVGNELWKSDGTVAGTVKVTGFNYFPDDFIAFNNQLFFSLSSGSDPTLWKSDGTAAGTQEVTPDVTSPDHFTVTNNMLFFTGIGNASVYGDVGRELFKTDGTQSGTLLMKDITPGSGDTYLEHPVSFNGALYFFAEGNLWKSNGLPSGTKLVKSVDINGDGQTSDVDPAHGNGKLYFVSDNTLWVSDGSSAGTYTVIDTLLSSVTFGFPASIEVVGTKVFFVGNTYAYGTELYVGETATLPIKLLSFTGTLNKQDGLLKWSTASEQNNNYFNLQRSTDGAEFRTIARIKGAGNSQAQTDYTYTDPNITLLGKDKFYYRLQQVDQDGTPTLSNIVLIDISKKPAEYTVAPNPAKNSINLYSSATVGNAQVSLVDFSGKRVYTTRKNLVAGQPLQIESAGLAAGLYVLKIETSAGVSQVKVVKQ